MEADEEAEAPITVEAEPPQQSEPLAAPPAADSLPSEEQSATQIIIIVGLPVVEAAIESELVFSTTIAAFVPQSFDQAKVLLTEGASHFVAYIDSVRLWDRLDDFQGEIDQNFFMSTYTAGTIAVTSMAVSAGYVFWMVKGGCLLASVVSQLPVWQFMDPLPIFDAASSGMWSKEDEIEGMFD